jgi:hypothetical protein
MADGGNTVPRIVKAEHIGPADTGDNVEAKRVATYDTPDGVNWMRSGSPLAVRIDDTTTTDVTYIGKALIGTATSAATWQISKLDTASGMIKTWADGDGLFNNIWDNRSSLSYN